MTTTAVYTFVALLLAWALWRRQEALTVSLALAFMASVSAFQYVRGDDLRAILMGIDGFAVVASWWCWRRYDSSRAATVTGIGLVKICFGIAAAATGMDWLLWASGNNALFILQVLVAGGFLNGLMAWLGRSRDSAHPGGNRLLGYLERLP